MSFICYKLTHDSGFAPNPHFGVITLATCKPSLRRTKKADDWIAGFSTQALFNQTKRETYKKIEPDGLIYLMKVGERLTLDQYYRDSRFTKKKPLYNHRDDATRAGDNIYYKKGDMYFQHENNSHPYMDENDSITRPNIDYDTAGQNVLIANMAESYYFGDKCLLPSGGWKKIGFVISTGRTFYGTGEDLEKLQKFIRDSGFQPGIHGDPCLRPPPPVFVEANAVCGSGCSGILRS